MTARDRAGLAAFLGADAPLAMLPPFIDTAAFAARAAAPAGRDDGPVRLVTTGMMRPGNKVESYAVLAQALATLGQRAWTLDIIGDGPERERVRGFFAGLKKKGIDVAVLERVRQVGPNKEGAKGSFTIYRIAT